MAERRAGARYRTTVTRSFTVRDRPRTSAERAVTPLWAVRVDLTAWFPADTDLGDLRGQPAEQHELCGTSGWVTLVASPGATMGLRHSCEVIMLAAGGT
jgi:hypothetical protein